MQPEHCPFHRREDTCAATARLLVQAGLLDPAPHAPAAGGTTVGVPPVPPRPVTLALITEHVNAWGRVVIDPTLPHADVTALEERSLRYILQALWEAAGEATRGSIRSVDGAAVVHRPAPPRPRPHPVEGPHRPHTAAVTGRSVPC